MSIEDATDPDLRDPIEDERVASLVRRWGLAIAASIDSANEAQRTLGELENCDDEMFESSAAADARTALATALKHLYSAGNIARGRLKLVEEAERDAELKRLRARNEELERLLADREATP